MSKYKNKNIYLIKISKYLHFHINDKFLYNKKTKHICKNKLPQKVADKRGGDMH